jgi:hypothetical protein
MHYAYATLAVVQAFGQEGSELVPGFVAVEAMQVDFILSHPAPTAQVTQDVLGHSLVQVMRFVTTFQPVLQLNAAVQAFMQRSAFIGDVLQRPWRGRAGAVLD